MHQVLLYAALIEEILIHAGIAAPWVGVNALDALVQVWNGISMMRQQLMPTDRVHGIVTDGGQAVSLCVCVCKHKSPIIDHNVVLAQCHS
jgi:hypothetical protein